MTEEKKKRPPGTPTSAQRFGTDTVILVAFVFLLIGFIGGVFFKSYQIGSSPSPGARPNSQGDGGGHAPVHSETDLEELRAIASANPTSVEAWRHLGDANFDLNRYQGAIFAYNKALEIDSSNPDIWTDLGVMYRRAGDPEKAVEAFEKAIEEDPDHQISRFNKGVVLFNDLNDPKGAVESWKALLLINPDARTPRGQRVKELLEELEAN